VPGSNSPDFSFYKNDIGSEYVENLMDYTPTNAQNGNLSVNLLKMWTLLQQLTAKEASEETVLCASVEQYYLYVSPSRKSCFLAKKVY